MAALNGMETLGLYSPIPAAPFNETDRAARTAELGNTAYLVITSNRVTDSQFTTSLWLNTVLGLGCFLVFCVLQRSVFPKHYRYRLHSPSVTVKPRPLPTRGLKSYWKWLAVACMSTEGEIMRSCGLDAVVMIKSLSMGVKIFLPLAFIGCGVLLPIHYKYRSLENQDINRSQLMQLTIAALPRGSDLMWIHFILIVLYNCWVMWVLFARYKEFVICRQHYLVKGDDPNYWIVAACKAEAEHAKKSVQKLLIQLRGQVDNPDKKIDPGDPAPMALEPGPSTSPEPNVRDSVQSGMRSVLGRMSHGMSHGMNLVGQSMNNLLKGKVIRRSSFESYKRYSDENNSTRQSPVTSPNATPLGSIGHQGWGLPRARSGATSRRSSDGMGSGGDSPHGDGMGGQAAAAGQVLSAGLLEAGTAGAGSAGSHSSDSSRRWSGSSGGTSEGNLASKSFEAGSSDPSGRRSRVSRQGNKGRIATLPVSVGASPTHQTINELQSMALQGALPVPLGSSYSDPPNQWPLIPKHMRTITEDSLEYRLDSSQGNNSRPSSRGGLFGSNTGHNRDSSAGTGDSPLSAFGRAQAASLSQPLPAAGDSSSFSHRHSHSHSHSGGSSSGIAAGANAVTMSPLRRNSNLQPAVLDSSSSGQPALVQDPAMRVSMESLGRYSVCTRVTHDSSPEDDDDFRTGTNSTRSSPGRDLGSRGSSPGAPDSDLASYITPATRDLSFGGMGDLQQQRQSGQHSGRSSTSGIAPEQIRIGSFEVAANPAEVASQAPAPHHGYQTSVDFGAMHLEDLSRPDELPSPEGGFISPQPRPSRASRNRGDSAAGRTSPFAESDGIALRIVAAGVGNLDEFRRVGIQRVQGVQSNPVPAAGIGSELQSSQHDHVNKQRFVRPGPGWQPPSVEGAPQHKPSSSVHRHQPQPDLQQQDSAAAAAGTAPRSVKSAAALQHSTEEQDGLKQGKPQPLQVLKQQEWSAVAAEGKAASDASSAASSRVSSATGLQNLQARATRQRVMPPHISTTCGRSSPEPSPGQGPLSWAGNTWQLHAKSSNSCTSNSGPSCQFSPYGQQSFIIPKEVQAVAGAAVGAGQEMAAPSAAAAAALMSPGPVAGVQPMQVVNNADGEGTKRPAVVVHPWWKDLALPGLQGSDALEYWAHEEDPSYLAKPSVRYRKTVNCWSREEQRVIGVMAQHYAVLVTDVEQWPYPELQMAHEAAKQNSAPQRAWRWLYDNTNTLLQRLTGGPPEQLWMYPPDIPQVQEDQHLLLQQQQEGIGMSDKHLFQVLSPLPAMIDPVALTGGTSGGASVVVSRSSRGHNRGQLSSCATSSEGLLGIGAGVANSMARISMHSHTTQHSYLPCDLSEGLVNEAQELAFLEQKVLHRSEETLQKQQHLANIEKVKDKIQRFNLQQHERQQVLSRDHSSYHLTPLSRTASYLRMGGLATSGGFGQAGAMPGGWANQLASRTSSLRSIQQVRAEHAVAGAAVGAPELATRAQGASNISSRGPTPTSGRGSLDAGMGAGPLTKDRLDCALAIMHTHREQQLRRRHASLQQGWSFVESPWSPRQESSTASAGEIGRGGVAQTAAAGSAHIAPAYPALEQVLSEPTTMAASAAAHVLQQKLSHSEPEAVADRQPDGGYDPAADHSVGGYPPLVGQLSRSHSPLGIEEASTAAADPSAAAMAADPGRFSMGPAFTGVQLAPQHHRRYVYRSASPSGGSPDGLAREAALSATPSPSPSFTSQMDDGDKTSWSNTPTSPKPDYEAEAAPAAAAAAVQPEVRTVDKAAEDASQKLQRSVGGAFAGGGMGLSDSLESNASSHAARRPAVQFRPYPPDSPRAREQLTQQGFGSIVLVDGPAARQQSLRASIATRSVARLAGSGGSGGGIPAGPIPLQAAGRSRSARLSNNFADGGLHTSGSVSHADHLCVIIPPPQQQMPSVSRNTTPRASYGGFAGSGGGLGSGGGIAPLHLPVAPWGLPPDATLLTSSASTHTISSGGPADVTIHAAPVRSRVSASSMHPPRWSVPGLPAERSTGNIASIVASPMSDRTEGGLIPAIGGLAGTGQAVLVGSNSEADAKATAALGQGDSTAPATRKGPELWRLVVKAHNEGRLMQLLQLDSYSVVTATFKRLFPEDFDKAIPVIDHRKVDMLLMQWEEAVAELERARLKQLRTGVPPMRFTGRLGKLLSCFSSMGCQSSDSRGQMCGTCCEGHMEEVIPAIEERISDLEVQIEQARRDAFASKFTPSWFVLFKSQKAASIAASTRIYAEDSTRFQVHPAPGPEEVNWQHLWMSYKERDCRTALTWPLMLLVVLFPITLVTSAASRLEYVFCPDVTAGDPTPAFVWQWYCTGKEQGSALPIFIRALFTGWLPSLLLNLWLTMVLPRLVYLIVQSEGSCYSLSALERRIGAVFYLWDVFNVFLQGTIGSTFFQQVRRIIQTPEQLPNILGAALPDSSNFFMQFIAMRALFLVWLRLCVPHGGVWQNWCRICLCPPSCCSTCNTERDQSLTYGPRTPRYGFEMGHVLMMYLIALAFAIVSPMLLPFSVVWFMFAWVAWRHNLNYVYQRKYESGGLMWIFLFSRIVMCMVIGQLFTFCVLVVKGAYWQAFLTIAFMPALTARFYRYCQARFARGIEYGVPLDMADRAYRTSVPAHIYIPPPLQDSSFGWYPEWNKIWDGWGMPAYAAV